MQDKVFLPKIISPIGASSAAHSVGQKSHKGQHAGSRRIFVQKIRAVGLPRAKILVEAWRRMGAAARPGAVVRGEEAGREGTAWDRRVPFDTWVSTGGVTSREHTWHGHHTYHSVPEKDHDPSPVPRACLGGSSKLLGVLRPLL